MTWTTLALQPLDGLFFRDDRPFNQDDEGLAEARSLFPPFPTQLVGGLRAALARAAGWDGTRDGYDATMIATFGDGARDAGTLRFGPPVVLRRTPLGDSWEPLYPLPAAVLCQARTMAQQKSDRKKKREPYPAHEVVLALPGKGGILCDSALGAEMCLPALPDEKGFKQKSGLWITAEGLKFLLSKINAVDQPKVHVIAADSLLASERRVGLERNYGTHRATTGMLYTAAHHRLKAHHALGVAYDWKDGRAEALPQPAAVIPLGGHGRATTVEIAAGHDLLPWGLTPKADAFFLEGDWLNVMVVLISPAQLDKASLEQEIGGALVSACIDRPLMFGGWSAGKRLPVARYHAAGSTFFFRVRCRNEADRAARVETLKAKQQEGLGAGKEVGCGGFVVGTWSPWEQGDEREKR